MVVMLGMSSTELNISARLVIDYDGGRAWCLSLDVRERTAITQLDWEVIS